MHVLLNEARGVFRAEDVVEEMVQGMLAVDHTLCRLGNLNVVLRVDYETSKQNQVFGWRVFEKSHMPAVVSHPLLPTRSPSFLEEALDTSQPTQGSLERGCSLPRCSGGSLHRRQLPLSSRPSALWQAPKAACSLSRITRVSFWLETGAWAVFCSDL